MSVLRVGADVGGTFTDIVAVDEAGSIYYTKTPSTPQDQSIGVLNGILKMLKELGESSSAVAQLVHGTTVATNALLERKGAVTALITTNGFRDILHIGRQNRPNLYDLQARRPDPLAPRRLRAEVDERTLYTGEIDTPLNTEQLRAIVKDLLKDGAKSLAICFLHSYANPAHEQQALAEVKAVAPDLPVSISSDILPEFREFERMSTTVLNAYVQPVMDHYIKRLQNRLNQNDLNGPLMVMQSNGGMMTADAAANRSVHTLLSGPAGGVLAAAYLSELTGTPDFITGDVGGTSFDVAVIEGGKPVLRTEGVIEGYPVKFPHIDIHTIGAGGGSIAWIDNGGALRAGPQSAGAVPGPVCYRRGGTVPTVTDANAVLGRLGAASLMGSEMELDIPAARKAIEEQIARPLKLTVEEAAEGILRVINASMARAIRVITVERGLDPRKFTLLPYGGAGPLHSADLSRQLGIGQVMVPIAPGNFSAFGVLTAPVRYDEVATYRTSDDKVDLPRLEKIFADLEAAAANRLQEEGFSVDQIAYERRVDLRYLGQAYEITVDFPAGDVARAAWETAIQRFHAAHEKAYGFARPGNPMEMVNVRLTGAVPTEAPQLTTLDAAPASEVPKPVTTRQAYFGGSWVETPIYRRDEFRAGHRCDGPAIVEEKGSTTVLYAGDHVEVDGWGNLVIHISRPLESGREVGVAVGASKK